MVKRGYRIYKLKKWPEDREWKHIFVAEVALKKGRKKKVEVKMFRKDDNSNVFNFELEQGSGNSWNLVEKEKQKKNTKWFDAFFGPNFVHVYKHISKQVYVISVEDSCPDANDDFLLLGNYIVFSDEMSRKDIDNEIKKLNCVVRGQVNFYDVVMIKNYSFYGKKIRANDCFKITGSKGQSTRRFVDSVTNYLYPAEVDYLTYKYLMQKNELVLPALVHYQQAIEKYFKFFSWYFYNIEPTTGADTHKFEKVIEGTDLGDVIPIKTKEIFKEICDEFYGYRYYNGKLKPKKIEEIENALDDFVCEFWVLLMSSIFPYHYKIFRSAGYSHAILLPRIYQSNGKLREKYLHIVKRNNAHFEKMGKLFKKSKF
ncbi:MAG: hypothetical protein WC570_00215 [Patescibacteria group bacterium]